MTIFFTTEWRRGKGVRKVSDFNAVRERSFRRFRAPRLIRQHLARVRARDAEEKGDRNMRIFHGCRRNNSLVLFPGYFFFFLSSLIGLTGLRRTP